jgi:1-acyl-sn-glycerol-3-phosphate acyltransferase
MLRSIIIVTVSLFFTALASALVVIRSLFSEAGRINRKIARLWANILLKITGIRVTIIGRENFVTGKPQIFMANHQSDFDILIFLAAIPADFVWTAKKELFSIPVFGRAMKKAGYIAIDRNDHEKALENLAEAAEKIRGGLSVASFPEGTRSRDGKLLPFKPGMFYLALQTGAPIVPIAIIGSGKIMSKKSLKVNRGEITMVIDKPIDVSGYGVETRHVLMERVRSIICVNHDRYQAEAKAAVPDGVSQ